MIAEILAKTADESGVTNTLNIAIILAVAVVVSVVGRWLIGRVIRRIGRIPGLKTSKSARVVLGGAQDRLAQRLRTFQSVLTSTLMIVVWTVALIMVLSELGVNVAPLIASAGVLGVALAFGAQSLVRDIISGLFMLVEDQYGIGDRVELGAAGVIMAAGTVERVALRVTTVRDDDGRLWHVRNGEVLRVSNQSQGWAQAVVEIRLAPDTDITAAREAIRDVSAALAADDAYAGCVLAEPEIRVEDVTAAEILLRWSVRTAPGEQWRVASGLRRRLPAALAEAGIVLAGGA